MRAFSPDRGREALLPEREMCLIPAGEGAAFEVEILGDLRPARIQPKPLYDPDGARMRS
jgi:glycine cleavage system aminomethyltransferase T